MKQTNEDYLRWNAVIYNKNPIWRINSRDLLMSSRKTSFLIDLVTKRDIKTFMWNSDMKKSTNLYLATILRIFHIFCTHWSICHAFITHSRSVNKPSKFAVGSSSTVINNRKLPIYPQQISSINLSPCHTDRHSWSVTASFLVLNSRYRVHLNASRRRPTRRPPTTATCNVGNWLH